MLRHLMMWWHLNILKLWKVKIWLSQEDKELSKQNKTFFCASRVLSFRLTKQTSKKVADTTFNKDACFQSVTSLKTKLLCKYISQPFSKLLEQVLNRNLSRGCCRTKILKFLFLNVLSFSKKIVYYVKYLPFFSLLLILHPSCVRDWNSESYLSAAVTYCRLISSLWVSQKLWRMKHECITYVKSSRVICMYF